MKTPLWGAKVLSRHVLLCLAQPFLTKKTSGCIISGTVSAISWKMSPASTFRFHFRSVTTVQILLGRSKIQQIWVDFQNFELALRHKSWQKSCCGVSAFKNSLIEEMKTRQWLVLSDQSVHLLILTSSIDLVFWHVRYW